ncbi:MAG: YsnF/AvaK domain-containing protein [Myxococcales bacterium]
MQAGFEDSSRKDAKLKPERDEDLVIPIVEEELEIGKREVEAGGVRVSTRVSAVPVERSITLREEHVSVERRAVDRPITDRDEAFRERSLEMRASAELPYATKRAHVVEEIRVHKDAAEHEERIRDSVRHTDVDIAEIEARAMPMRNPPPTQH